MQNDGKVLRRKFSGRSTTAKKNAPVRGRPRGQLNDKKSYGPLGDLIRSARISKKLGLAEIARACRCSVQFISNIEHGRAPLPWEKIEVLATALDLTPAQLQSANLIVRSDFKKFASSGHALPLSPAQSLQAIHAPAAWADPDIQSLLNRYQSATVEKKQAFLSEAAKWL